MFVNRSNCLIKNLTEIDSLPHLKLYEADPLTCPKCGGPMRVIALIDDPRVVRRILEHLGRWAPEEVPKLMKAAGATGRHGHRDATLLMVAYRHGLRVSELVALRWDQVDLKQGLMRVNRLKNGVASTHPIRGPELRALRRLQNEYEGPYRPFDTRYTYYTGRPKGIMGWPVEKLMNQFTAVSNVALITSRMTKGERFAHAQLTNKISEGICMSSKTSNNGFIFPLWLVPEVPRSDIPIEDQRYPNLSPDFLAALARSLGKSTAQTHHLPEAVSPEDVLTYVYAVLHAPSYRQRYAQYLKSDFPRIPIAVIAPADKAHAAEPFAAVWEALIPLGSELKELHLLRKVPAELRPHFPHQGSRKVEKVRYEPPRDNSLGRVWINATQCFEGVEPETWAFMVGGYQVCEKWLKYRKGRDLTLQDIEHYQSIVAVLTRTRAVMTAIDDLVNGKLWPLSAPSQVDH